MFEAIIVNRAVISDKNENITKYLKMVFAMLESYTNNVKCLEVLCLKTTENLSLAENTGTSN